MTPMNFELGLSQSKSQAIKTGPFSATSGDWVVGASGETTAPRSTATNWGLLAIVAGLVLVAVFGLAVWGQKGR